MTKLITKIAKRVKLEIQLTGAHIRFMRSLTELREALDTNASNATTYGTLYNYQSIMDLERKTEIYRERVFLIEDQIKAL